MYNETNKAMAVSIMDYGNREWEKKQAPEN